MKTKKTNSKYYLLVMAGGSGTRFWPESTNKRPKQYIALTGEKTLLEQTLERFDGQIPPEQRYIVTISKQKQLAKKYSKESVGAESIILEPLARNTAPCILLSLVYLLNQGANPEDVVAVIPSDHCIKDVEAHRQSFLEAYTLASTSDQIVTIGIPPLYPHTGLGHIKKGRTMHHAGIEYFHAEKFVEKPAYQLAKEYTESKNYLWNAGMFITSIQTLLSQIEKHAPEIAAFKEQLASSLKENNPTQLAQVYGQIPKISIDYAVMEKSEKIVMLQSKFDWNDLGSWDALETLYPADHNQNTFVESDQGKYQFINNSKGNIIKRDPKKMLVLSNMNDYIIIDHPKALVIIPKNESQKIKDVVGHLSEQDWGEQFL